MGSTGQKTVRIGVDVGGTNTDAVAIEPSKQFTESRGVLAHHKTPTTPDVTEGIEAAVRNVLQKSRLPSESIASVTVGTTHFINAVIEQDARRLRRVAIIRISKSFLREVPPFSEFPPGLTSIIKGYVGYVDGGLHIDGSQEAPLVEEQVVERCAEIKKLGLSSIVVVGAFSPIDDHFHQEDRVRDIVLKEIPGADVVVSHEVANIGLLERENASILNAAILRYAKRTVKGFRRAMKALKLTCPLFLTQNDGTLLDSAAAAKIPIRTFSSGPTNSMRGAAYLTGHETGNQSAIVVDIGGTTTDVGVLLPSGLPRQASAYVTVAGVKVNYSMPSLHSIGLGGGSIVRQQDGKVTVGPDSVGHYLTRDALVFGGKILTSSDIAVAAGKAQMGDSEAVESLDKALIPQAEERIKQLLEGAVDMIKTSPEPLPVLLVGGGAVLAPTSLKGASELKLPLYHDVANAVGAAISKVGGIVDIIQQIADISQNQAVERAKEMAIQKAVDAGAIKESIIIAEVETYPVTYMANQLRTIVKAVGELDINMQPSSLDDDEADGEDEAPEAAKDFAVKVVDEPPVDPRTYKPTIVKNEQGILEWQITETDIDYLADGCYVLGCAGGGSPAASRIQLRDMLRAGYKMRVIRPEDLPEPGNIYWGGHMGSPATSNERLQSLETVKAFEALMEYLKEDTFDAVMGLEIGGANGIEPFLVGSSRFYDRPVIDADWMGRAYPTYWQTTIAVHAPGELVPCVIDSGDGRYIWGMYGSYLAIIQRIVLSLVWFSVQSWTGGLCVQNILCAIFPSYQNLKNPFPASAKMDARQFIGWILFNLLMIPILYVRPEKMKWIILVFNIISALTLLSMVIWVMNEAGGGGPLLSQPATAKTSWELGWSIVHGVTTVIGGIAVGLTNQMDYSRFARRPGDQVFGQWFSIIVFGAIMPSLGCLSASASQGVYGEAIWNPPNLVQKWLDTDYGPKSRAAAFFAGVGLVICQLAINTIDNAFSTGMDTAGLFPSYINIRRGAYIGLVLSIAMCPWQLLSAASTFISVLSAYSVFLGPMVGIMTCDYWILRKRKLKLSDLYNPHKDGVYYYWRGINWRSFTSWVIGWAYLLPGFAHAVTPNVKVPEACTNLYYLAFPLGFAVSFTVHYAINKLWPPIGLGEKDDEDFYGTFTEEEGARLGVATLYTIDGEESATPPEDEIDKSKAAKTKVTKV